MIYLLKSNTSRPYRFTLVLIVSVFCILSLLLFLFPVSIRSLFRSLAQPVWAVRDTTVNGFGNVTHFFSAQSHLVSENNNLKNQIAELNLKVIDYGNILTQNEDLKNMLGREYTASTTIARIISKPPQSPYDTFVIDVGMDDGIALGDMVYVSDTIIIGTIQSVTAHTSLVDLFSSGGQKTEATLERTGATFTLVGGGGANFSVQVPKEADVLWGDVFDYPTLSSSVLGNVYYIDTISQSSFKTVFIRAPINIFESQWVFVKKSL